jgi:hypothetical protein
MAMKLGTAMAVAIFATYGFLGAQARQNPATIDDLLSEIRGLRADIARSSNATTRTQMLVARMQVQEQRVNTTVRRIAEVQSELAQARQLVVGLEVEVEAVCERRLEREYVRPTSGGA